MVDPSDLIYLGSNATTPVDQRVAEAMQPYLSGCYGNPSSSHQLGRVARQALGHARSQVASCLGCDPDEIVFTSGGSEANNTAIRGVVAARGGGHLVTSAVEHPAVLEGRGSRGSTRRIRYAPCSFCSTTKGRAAPST